MKAQFLNQEHQSKFLELCDRMAAHYRFNKGCLSVIFIMAGDEDFYRKLVRYFNAQEGYFSSDQLFQEQDFSSDMRILAKLAVHLFNENETVSPIDLLSTLDDERLRLAINAIIILRYGIYFNS